MFDPNPIQYAKPWAIFWAVAVLAHGYMDYSFFRIWKRWSRGTKKGIGPQRNRLAALKIWIAEILFQRQLFILSPVRWGVHMLIFWGFLSLALLSLTTCITAALEMADVYGAAGHFFSSIRGHILVKIWGDTFGLSLLIGLAAASVRRFLLRPSQQATEQADTLLLLFLLWLTLSGFVLEGLRLSLVPPEIARYSLIGSLFMPRGFHSLVQLQPWLTACWCLHVFSGLTLLVYLPHSKLIHSISAPLVIALNASAEFARKDIYWPDISKHRPTGSLKD
jgi:heterodisulfide reductase subunit E